jgi:hypothetical protein
MTGRAFIGKALLTELTAGTSEQMSTTAMRTPAKVQSLCAHEIDGGEKNAGSQTHLARAVTLHLAGKREEALKQLQRAIAANEAWPRFTAPWAHLVRTLQLREAAKSYRILAQVKPQPPWAGLTWRSAWNAPARGRTPPGVPSRLYARCGLRGRTSASVSPPSPGDPGSAVQLQPLPGLNGP